MQPEAANSSIKCPVCGLGTGQCICREDQTHKMQGSGAAPFDSLPQQPQLNTTRQCSTIGTTIAGSYQLVSEVGSGGMGAVYKAQHIRLPKSFAIKILKQELNDDPDFRARFEREAKTASILNHANLISIIDSGTTELGEGYLVMDYLDGRSLADVLSLQKRLDENFAVPLFMQICEGLKHAHSLGIVHRDLKPSNIMLVKSADNKETAKIVDFGIAKAMLDGTALGTPQSLTRTGQFFGSPLYMSPEQGSGAAPDSRSDIYSMGILMYECLSSAPPFRGENFFATMVMHNETMPKPFSKELGIGQKLEKIVRKALEKDPQDRFQSAEQLREELALYLESKNKGEGAAPQLRQKSSRNASLRWLTGAATALLLITAVAAFYLAPHKKHAPPAMSPAGPGVRHSEPVETTPAAIQPGASTAEPTSGVPVLPEIPENVRLPENDKKLSAFELKCKGYALAHMPDLRWDDYLPARYLTEAALKDPRNAGIYFDMQDLYWMQRDKAPESEKDKLLDKCLTVNNQLLKFCPHEYQGYVTRSTYLETKKQFDKSLTDIDYALTLRPKDPEMHMKRGYVLRQLGRLSEAAAELEPYVTAKDKGKLYVLATCYNDLNQYQKAIVFCDKWLRKIGPDPGLLLVRGDCLRSQGRYREALADYEQLNKVAGPSFHERDSTIAECRQLLAR